MGREAGKAGVPALRDRPHLPFTATPVQLCEHERSFGGRRRHVEADQLGPRVAVVEPELQTLHLVQRLPFGGGSDRQRLDTGGQPGQIDRQRIVAPRLAGVPHGPIR